MTRPYHFRSEATRAAKVAFAKARMTPAFKTMLLAAQAEAADRVDVPDWVPLGLAHRYRQLAATRGAATAARVIRRRKAEILAELERRV